jgi:hypothetical protein
VQPQNGANYRTVTHLAPNRQDHGHMGPCDHVHIQKGPKGLNHMVMVGSVRVGGSIAHIHMTRGQGLASAQTAPHIKTIATYIHCLTYI